MSFRNISIKDVMEFLLNTINSYKYYDRNNKNQCLMLARGIKASVTDMLPKWN